MCMGELDAEPHHTCPDCETPIHVACGDEIAGCARYACPRAASTRGRILEYARLRVNQELSVARAVMRSFGVWCGICALVGTGSLAYLAAHVSELRDPLSAINFGGFLSVPATAAWIIGITRLWTIPQPILGFVGFALPIGAFSLARDKTHRLTALQACVSAPTLSDRARILLLRHDAPGRSAAPQLSGPIARAAHVSAVLAGLAALFQLGRAATTPLRGPYPTMFILYAVIFAVVALGLRYVARSLEQDLLSTRTARRLLELWRPEFEEILRDTERAASTELLIDDAARMQKAKT